MALKLVEKKVYRLEAYISLSGTYSRLMLFQATYNLMKEKAGGKVFTHVQFYIDPDQKRRFWMRVAQEGDPAAVKIAKTGNNRILSVVPLLQELNWKIKSTVRLPVRWDSKNRAWVVDFSTLAISADSAINAEETKDQPE